MRNFVSIAACSLPELEHLFDVSDRLKKQLKETGKNDPLLAHKTLAMIFEKPSLRTHVAFSVAMAHLGGQGVLLRNEEVGLETREPSKDIARVLSTMCDGIMARVFQHQKILDLAKYATVPVINGLTDYSHPCQAMADLMTMREKFGPDLKGRTMAFIGDGNNVARSLSVACGKFGVRFILASPAGYELPPADMDRIMAQVPSMDFQTTNSPAEAVKEADVIYTDTWISMGQEADKQRRLHDFSGYVVDEKLLAAAPKHAIVMHCLPAYRGKEITESVMEGPQSVIFPQASNRLHFQKGLLAVLMGGA
jgi:ornithine carbamoyltransferase